ncbi:MAG: nucleoside triphosphate pyrophosphohydrolase [Chloroflexi bacterium]|nr:nucleoside triphosphate pyrophosphohydrolase [Chloroflexota bacterium]
MSDATGPAFSHLVDLLEQLRGPQGCPWDLEQTHQSLKRNLLEESYEVLDAIDRQDPDVSGLAEELGDVLLQVLFHAQIAREAGRFSVDDVLEAIRDKLVRRHPHVFGDAQVKDAREVEAQWEELKRQERQADPAQASRLGDLPLAMPALAYSQLIQDRASRAGFDWPALDGVLDKVAEELREISEAPTPQEKAREFGDLLFSMVNVGRWMGLHTEDTLRQANARFHHRFTTMERLAAGRGAAFEALDPEAKDKLWTEAKRLEGPGG